MKIAHITNNYTPYSGGVVSSIRAFSRQFLKNGHDLRIITLDFLGSQHEDPEYVLRVPSLVRFDRNNNKMAVPWRAGRVIERFLDDFNPDVVHLHHPFLLCQKGLKIARKRKIPVVFTYHSIYERYAHYVPFYQPLVQYAVKRKVLRFCGTVDHIIAPSTFIQHYLLSQGIKTPISVIPSPLQDMFLGNVVINRSKTEKFRLLLVSRLVKEKSVEYLLEIVSKLPPERFLFTIVGYGAHEAELRYYAYKTLKLKDSQVQFVIKPPKEQLLKYYCEADLFLFSSTSDTQGLVLAEAMAGGTPVVAVDGPGQRDIIKQGENGFIVDSQKEMLQKIKQIADNDDLFAKLRKCSIATANTYSPQQRTKQVVQIYEKLT